MAGRAWWKWIRPYNLGNIPGQVKCFLCPEKISWFGWGFIWPALVPCAVVSAVPALWPWTLAGADDCSCNGPQQGWWKLEMLVITILIQCWVVNTFSAFSVSDLVLNSYMSVFSMFRKKPRNLCSFSHTCHQLLARLLSSVLRASPSRLSGCPLCCHLSLSYLRGLSWAPRLHPVS